MSFALGRGERMDVGARRVAREGASLVLRAIAVSESDEAVHEARRTIKRLRALVRLIAPAIGDQAEEADELLRAAAADFAGSRDAAVMLATFESVAAGEANASEIRQGLERAYAASDRDDRDAEARIRAFAAGSEAWTFDGAWSSIEPGVFRTYRAGRGALREAEEKKVELHDVRKRVKDLQFQLTLLRAAWPDAIGAYVTVLRKLGTQLGEEHDLLVLGDALAKMKLDASPYLERIADRRTKLRRRILPSASRVYVDKPRAWTRRLRVWWET